MSDVKKAILATAVFALVLPMTPSPVAQESSAPKAPAWITRSNANAQLLLDVEAKYSPEAAQQRGMPGFDDSVTQLASDRRARQKADREGALRELQRRLDAEKDPLVGQDLQILIKAAKQTLRGQELNEKYQLPYVNVPAVVFNGLRTLLDDQIAPERRKAALVRLRK